MIKPISDAAAHLSVVSRECVVWESAITHRMPAPQISQRGPIFPRTQYCASRKGRLSPRDSPQSPPLPTDVHEPFARIPLSRIPGLDRAPSILRLSLDLPRCREWVLWLPPGRRNSLRRSESTQGRSLQYCDRGVGQSREEGPCPGSVLLSLTWVGNCVSSDSCLDVPLPRHAEDSNRRSRDLPGRPLSLSASRRLPTRGRLH